MNPYEKIGTSFNNVFPEAKDGITIAGDATWIDMWLDMWLDMWMPYESQNPLVATIGNWILEP